MPAGQSKTSSGDSLWSDCLVVREPWVTDSVFGGLNVMRSQSCRTLSFCLAGSGFCSLCVCLHLPCLTCKCIAMGSSNSILGDPPELDKKNSVYLLKEIKCLYKLI